MPHLLDSKCVAPQSRLETVRRSIEFKGNHTWDIHHDKKDTGENKRVIGQVHCPCKDGAKDMSEDEAMRRIFGQVSALPFDQGKVVRLGGGSQRRASQIRLLMKVSFSTKLLLDCWKNTCKKSSTACLEIPVSTVHMAWRVTGVYGLAGHCVLRYPCLWCVWPGGSLCLEMPMSVQR